MRKQSHVVDEQQQLSDFAYPNLSQLKPVFWPFWGHLGYFSYLNSMINMRWAGYGSGNMVSHLKGGFT
jgi:hypothetical protein